MSPLSQRYNIHGSFDWFVINEEDHFVEHSGGRSNLILNQGIDYCFQRSFVENMQACALSAEYIAPLKSDTYLQGEFIRTSQAQTVSELNRTQTVSASASAGGGFTYPIRTITYTKSFRFPRFDVRTPIGMIGISYSAVSGANLFAKSLIGESPISVDQGRYFQLNYSLSVTFPSSYDSAIPIATPGYSTLGYLGYFGASNLQVDPTVLAGNGNWNSSGWQSSQLIGLMAIGSDGTISPYTEAVSGAVNMVTGFQTGLSGPDVVLNQVLGTPSGTFLGQGCNEPASGCTLFLSTNGQSPNITSCSIDRSANTSLTKAATVTYLGNGVGIKYANFGKNTAITGVYSWGLGGATSPTKNCGYVFVSTGISYSGSSYITGLPSNGYTGFTKEPTNELTLQFIYAVTSQ